MKLKDLSPGSKILFGRYQIDKENPEPIKWILGDQNHYKENFCPMITEFALDLRAFDVKEPNNPDNNRKVYGNNDYRYSNIDQWLNSNKKNNWFVKKHEYDEAPIAEYVGEQFEYNEKPGFLSNFTPDEQNIIQEVVIEYLPPLEENKISLNRKIFLLSLGEYGGSNSEGSKWSIFTTSFTMAGISTLKLEEKYNIANGSYLKNLTRTATLNYTEYVRYVYPGALKPNTYATTGNFCIRPALNLSSNLEVSELNEYYKITVPKFKYILYNKGVGK